MNPVGGQISHVDFQFGTIRKKKKNVNEGGLDKRKRSKSRTRILKKRKGVVYIDIAPFTTDGSYLQLFDRVRHDSYPIR